MFWPLKVLDNVSSSRGKSKEIYTDRTARVLTKRYNKVVYLNTYLKGLLKEITNESTKYHLSTFFRLKKCYVVYRYDDISVMLRELNYCQ